MICIQRCTKPEDESPNYQLAFFTPGILPSKALSRKENYKRLALQLLLLISAIIHTRVIRKSLKTPRDFPPSVHLLLICVNLV